MKTSGIILLLALLPGPGWAAVENPNAGLQAIRDLRPVPDERWSVQLSTSFRELERREFEGLFAVPRQDTTTAYTVDATVRFNATDAVQVFASLPAVTSRRRVVSAFSSATTTRNFHVPSAAAGIQWTPPESISQYLGRGTLQASWIEDFAAGGFDAISLGYTFTHVTHPLILYGQLQHTRVLGASFADVAELRSTATSSLRLGGVFVVNYSTALNGSFDVRYRSSESLGEVQLISDLELRFRAGLTKALSDMVTVEPYVDFRVDGALSDVVAGVAAVMSF